MPANDAINLVLAELAEGKTLRYAVLKHYQCTNEGDVLSKLRELKKMPEVQVALATQDNKALTKEFVDSKLIEILREGKYPSGAPGIIKMAYGRVGIKFEEKEQTQSSDKLDWSDEQ